MLDSFFAADTASGLLFPWDYGWGAASVDIGIVKESYICYGLLQIVTDTFQSIFPWFHA